MCVHKHAQPNESDKYNFALKRHSAEHKSTLWKGLNAQVHIKVAAHCMFLYNRDYFHAVTDTLYVNEI